MTNRQFNVLLLCIVLSPRMSSTESTVIGAVLGMCVVLSMLIEYLEYKKAGKMK